MQEEMRESLRGYRSIYTGLASPGAAITGASAMTAGAGAGVAVRLCLLGLASLVARSEPHNVGLGALQKGRRTGV